MISHPFYRTLRSFIRRQGKLKGNRGQCVHLIQKERDQASPLRDVAIEHAQRDRLENQFPEQR